VARVESVASEAASGGATWRTAMTAAERVRYQRVGGTRVAEAVSYFEKLNKGAESTQAMLQRLVKNRQSERAAYQKLIEGTGQAFEAANVRAARIAESVEEAVQGTQTGSQSLQVIQERIAPVAAKGTNAMGRPLQSAATKSQQSTSRAVEAATTGANRATTGANRANQVNRFSQSNQQIRDIIGGGVKEGDYRSFMQGVRQRNRVQNWFSGLPRPIARRLSRDVINEALPKYVDISAKLIRAMMFDPKIDENGEVKFDIYEQQVNNLEAKIGEQDDAPLSEAQQHALQEEAKQAIHNIYYQKHTQVTPFAGVPFAEQIFGKEKLKEMSNVYYKFDDPYDMSMRYRDETLIESATWEGDFFQPSGNITSQRILKNKLARQIAVERLLSIANGDIFHGATVKADKHSAHSVHPNLEPQPAGLQPPDEPIHTATAVKDIVLNEGVVHSAEADTQSTSTDTQSSTPTQTQSYAYPHPIANMIASAAVSAPQPQSDSRVSTPAPQGAFAETTIEMSNAGVSIPAPPETLTDADFAAAFRRRRPQKSRSSDDHPSMSGQAYGYTEVDTYPDAGSGIPEWATGTYYQSAGGQAYAHREIPDTGVFQQMKLLPRSSSSQANEALAVLGIAGLTVTALSRVLVR
jgi:hypothetical protein